MPAVISLSIGPHHKPLDSSKLAIPPSPHSPLSPLSPKVPRPVHIPALLNNGTRRRSSVVVAHPQPSSPLPWRWQCHVCYRCYDLGTTRRCLDDGHTFCSGNHCESEKTTTTKRTRGKSKTSRKAKKACASEFDYEGWKAWGAWRKSIETAVTEAGSSSPPAAAGSTSDDKPREKKQKVHRQCHDNCSYPSECRWGNSFPVPLAGAKTTTNDEEEEDITSAHHTAEDNDEHLTTQAAKDEAREARAEADKQAAGERRIPTSFEEILGLTSKESSSPLKEQITREDLEDPDGDYDEYGQPIITVEDTEGDEDDAEEENQWDSETLYSIVEEDDAEGDYDEDGDETEADWNTISTDSTLHDEEEDADSEVPSTPSTTAIIANKPSVTIVRNTATRPATAPARLKADPGRGEHAQKKTRKVRKRLVKPMRAVVVDASTVGADGGSVVGKESEGESDNPLCYRRSYDDAREEKARWTANVFARAQEQEHDHGHGHGAEERKRGRRWREWFSS